MEVPAFTASASILVAVIVFILNQRAQLRTEQRQARLRRVEAQLRDLYGPLKALTDVNEDLWTKMRDAFFPEGSRRRDSSPLSGDQLKRWNAWVNHALMPGNREIRDLIVRHADLLIEIEMPVPMRQFCSHVAAYEALASEGSGAMGGIALIDHPGQPFFRYVRKSFTALKTEQSRLLGNVLPQRH